MRRSRMTYVGNRIAPMCNSHSFGPFPHLWDSLVPHDGSRMERWHCFELCRQGRQSMLYGSGSFQCVRSFSSAVRNIANHIAARTLCSDPASRQCLFWQSCTLLSGSSDATASSSSLRSGKMSSLVSLYMSASFLNLFRDSRRWYRSCLSRVPATNYPHCVPLFASTSRRGSFLAVVSGRFRFVFSFILD